jgi:hypothetical protein
MAARIAIRGIVSATLVAAVVALALGGCGSGSSGASSTPSPAPSKSGVAASVMALKTYYDQVKPITAQIGTTLAALPSAVKGLSKKPGATWTTASANLSAIATQLSEEASGLAELTPPATLKPVQDAAVKGIQTAQSAVARMANGLSKHAATATTKKLKIQSQISALETRLSSLGAKLTAAIGGLTGSPASTPTP